MNTKELEKLFVFTLLFFFVPIFSLFVFPLEYASNMTYFSEVGPQ